MDITDAASDAEGMLTAGRPSLLRAMNERSILEFIRRNGPVSRAQIARRSGLSKPTVSQALTTLERAHLVREAGRSSGGKGPTAVLYELNPSAGWILGIDVGREYVRAAVADVSGTILTQRRVRTRPRTSKTVIAAIGSVARDTAAAADVSLQKVTVAVVGSPGVFGGSGAHPLLAHNLPGWGRLGVLEAIAVELGCPVEFENDVNLAALGERWRGHGRGVQDFVYLHIGTGVGMGIVLDGELFRGSSGAAGEIGYLPLAAADPHDPSNRRRGALESAIGSDGVVAAAKREGMREPLSAAAIFAAASAGDVKAGRAAQAVGRGIALGIASIVPVLDPELVILGGGIGRNADLLRGPLERELHRLSPFRPRVEVSALGEDAELVGAVSLALRSAQERLFNRTQGKRRMAV